MDSVDPHTWEERNLSAVCHTVEPCPVPLEDTLSRQSVSVQDGVEATLSGVGLPTTIPQLNPTLTDTGDQVTVQANLSMLISVGDSGVTRCPVLIRSDGGVHLGFDLTHWWLPLFDSYKIQERGGLCHPLMPLVKLSTVLTRRVQYPLFERPHSHPLLIVTNPSNLLPVDISHHNNLRPK